MANMEFLNANELNTSTQIVLNTGQNTDSADFLFDGNPKLQYTSIGFTVASSSSIRITLPTTTTIISHVLIQNHNLKNFSVGRDTTTTVIFSTTAAFSETSTYIEITSVTASAIIFTITGAQTASSERSIGQIVIGERQSQFERNPTIGDFKPTTFRKQTRHIMPDGGVALYNVRDKLKAKLSWDFITTSFHNTLKDIYDPGDPLVFIQFPTATAWTGEASEVVWSGNFDFKHSTNDKSQGFSGSINLEQTANT